jgi:hypothetical protein
VDAAGSGSCVMSSFGIGSINSLVSAIMALVSFKCLCNVILRTI